VGKRSGTATDVQPATTWWYGEPPHELSCDEAAPTAHVEFVGTTAVPATVHSAGSVWLLIHSAVSLLVAAQTNPTDHIFLCSFHATLYYSSFSEA
jgi:hypothetical protein